MPLAGGFGELTIHPFSPNMDEHREVIVLDNHNANPPALTDQWHSDETFRLEPPTGTILRAEIVPEIGGDTMFASMTAAYAGLTPRLQHYLAGLNAIHDFKPFRTLFAGRPEAIGRLRKMEDEYPNPSHPVVRLHPQTGRPILNVNPQFTVRIEGMSTPESDSLLQFLYQQAKIPEYQLRVKWEPHTIVMWDNRSVQHYAVHDYYPQRRRMLRITVKGEKQIGIADSLGELTPMATLDDRKEGFRSEVGEMVTRESER